jgi:TRAP-type C4-dicarboxylate transport system permease small subunit
VGEIGLPNEGMRDQDQINPAFLVWLEKAGVIVSSIAIAILGAMIIISVTGRTFFASMIPDDLVFSGELMVTLVALPWAYITAERGHITVELFTNWVSERGRIRLDILATVVGLLMIGPLTWATGIALWQAIDYGSYFDGDLYLPEWPGRLMFFLGFLMTVIRLVLMLVSDAICLINYNDKVD